MASINDIVNDIKEGLTNTEILKKHNFKWYQYYRIKKIMKFEKYKIPVVNLPCHFGHKNEPYFKDEEEMLKGYIAPSYKEILKEYE